jgi:hypothetical protein
MIMRIEANEMTPDAHALDASLLGAAEYRAWPAMASPSRRSPRPG